MQKKGFFDILHNKAALDAPSAEGLNAVVCKFPYFQAAYVLYLKNLKEISHPDFGPVLKKVAVMVPDRKRLYRFLKTKHEIIPEGESVGQRNQQGFKLEGVEEENQSKNLLIEKFLSSNAGKISRSSEGEGHSRDFENEVVRKSAEEDDGIVTETLATIYLQQKKYDKALNAFRKLSLKYPEKSVYFASRIEEIERLKNIL